jgi:hypothetical protein
VIAPLAVLVVVVIVVTASASNARPSSPSDASNTAVAAPSKSNQPRPTATPDAPAIRIAKTPHEDLSGAWIMRDGDRYLMFTSNPFGDLTNKIPELSGTPGHWSPATDALPRMPSWAASYSVAGVTWQPEVHKVGSRYVLYYAAEIAGSDPRTRCLATAVSTTPAGPYSPSPFPIVCQRNEGGDIDAQVVWDDTAKGTRPYLVWKSDNNSSPEHGSDLIWAQPLAADGVTLTGTPKVIYSAGVAPAWAQPIVEAPQMIKSPFGGWWLFYSGGGGYFSPDYSVGVARCASITGPCTPVGSQPLITSNAQGAGVGEETLYIGDDGSTWLLYNPWHSGIPFEWYRPVDAVRIGWAPTGPYVAQAGRFPSP